MAKPKKVFVRNVATVKILNLALRTFAPRSTIRSLRLRIRTVMRFPGQAQATLVSKVPVRARRSQHKWLLNPQLKQLWSMA